MDVLEHPDGLVFAVAQMQCFRARVGGCCPAGVWQHARIYVRIDKINCHFATISRNYWFRQRWSYHVKQMSDRQSIRVTGARYREFSCKALLGCCTAAMDTLHELTRRQKKTSLFSTTQSTCTVHV